MSGHSKWATTKHKKAVVDAKRGKLFAKLIKNIEVAARTGGGDPGGNPTLYDAIQKAKKTSVPNDNIDRAIKRGSGAEGGGADWQNITYEGYAPGGVAVLVECLTDNRNRAAFVVRTALQSAGIDYDSAEASFVPSMSVPLEEDDAKKVFRLIDALEDCDDVQNVYANFDVSDEVMEKVG